MEDGTDVFVHYSGINSTEDFKSLKEGQTVTFDVVDTDKGKQAVKVEVINDDNVENVGGKEIMMNKEQTINKIMEEYGKYGFEKELAEHVYDMAIQTGVSHELIYPGMKMMFNHALDIDNKETIKEVGKGFTEFAVNDTRKANPTATDKVIAQNIKEELADEFDWKSIELPDEITDAIKDATENFVANNK